MPRSSVVMAGVLLAPGVTAVVPRGVRDGLFAGTFGDLVLAFSTTPTG